MSEPPIEEVLRAHEILLDAHQKHLKALMGNVGELYKFLQTAMQRVRNLEEQLLEDRSDRPDKVH